MTSLEPDEEDSLEERRRYLVEQVSWSGENFRKLICDDLDSATNQIAIDARLYNRGANTWRVLSTNVCDKRCIVTALRSEMCSNMETEIEYNVSLTFWLYLVIRVFIGQYIRGVSTFRVTSIYFFLRGREKIVHTSVN